MGDLVVAFLVVRLPTSLSAKLRLTPMVTLSFLEGDDFSGFLETFFAGVYLRLALPELSLSACSD